MLDDDGDKVDKAQERGERAAVSRNTQGLDRKGGKAVHPQGEELDESIAALALLAGPVRDRHGADAPGRAQDQSLHIGVAVFIDQHLVHDEAAHGKIACDRKLARLAQHDLGHAVIEHRAEVAEGRVLLVGILGVDHVIAFLQLADELARLIAGGLAVVVQTDDDLARRVFEPRHEGRVLAEVFCKVHGGDVFVGLGHLPQDAERVVGGAVIDQDQLIVVARHCLHRGFELVRDAADRVCRAVAGDHKGYKRHVTHPPRQASP